MTRSSGFLLLFFLFLKEVAFYFGLSQSIVLTFYWLVWFVYEHGKTQKLFGIAAVIKPELTFQF